MQLQRADAVCSLLLLQGKGLAASTVIDAGAAEGSFFLLRGEAGIYPDAHHFFIDAMEENVPVYEMVARRYPTSHEICALANIDGETELRIDPGVYNTHVGGLQPDLPGYSCRRVLVRTLDRLCRERPGLRPPYLLKIDVQGGELDVLRGASEVLESTSIIVLEAQICLFRDTLTDIMAYLYRRGFVLYDLTNLSYYRSDGTLYQCNAVFIPKHLDFRRMEPWSDAGQREEERRSLGARQQFIRQRLAEVCLSAPS